MAKYRANVKLFLAHENKLIEEGAEFETTFPKVKLKDGSEVDMRLEPNITALDAEAEADAPKAAAPAKRT